MLRVGVARGGPGMEYEASLTHGAAVLRALEDMSDEFEGVDILVDKEGTWHIRGMPVTLDTFLPRVDVIWNALHGEYGENGELARILDERGIPHTSAPHVIASTALNKDIFKAHMHDAGFSVPEGISYKKGDAESAEDLARDIHSHIAPPWVIKPVEGGHGEGIVLARSVPELIQVLTDAIEDDEPFLVEQYIYGREITGGVLRNFRGQDLYSLLPVEVRRKQGIPSASDRMEGRVPHLPLIGHEKEKKEIEQFFKAINKNMPLGYATTGDFIATPHGLYVLEIDAQPSVYEHSPIVHSLAEVGATIHDYVRSGIEFARRK